MTDTQPGREPEQGAGPENEIREQVEYGMGYADPGAQIGLGTREPTDDLAPRATSTPAPTRPRQQGRPRPASWWRAPRGGLGRKRPGT